MEISCCSRAQHTYLVPGRFPFLLLLLLLLKLPEVPPSFLLKYELICVPAVYLDDQLLAACLRLLRRELQLGLRTFGKFASAEETRQIMQEVLFHVAAVVVNALTVPLPLLLLVLRLLRLLLLSMMLSMLSVLFLWVLLLLSCVFLFPL